MNETNVLSIHDDQSVTVESILQEIKVNNPTYPINKCYRVLKQKRGSSRADILELNETHKSQYSRFVGQGPVRAVVCQHATGHYKLRM